MNAPMAIDLDQAQAWLRQWPDGLIVLDQSYCVQLLSAQAERILGLSQGQAQGQHVHQLLCAHSRSEAHDLDACPLCVNQPATPLSSAYWLTGDGFNLSVDFRCFALSLTTGELKVISFQDNAERMHNQAEMEKYAEYVDKSPAPIAEFDADGHMLFANPALQNLLLHWGFDELGHARVLPTNIYELCQSCVTDPELIQQLEVEVDTAWYSWHLQRLTTATDGEASVMAYAFDITQQKQAQAETARQKAEARRDFYAKMVHELRTPLNAIIGFSQVLQKRNADVLSPRELNKLKAIRAAGIQLNDMVTDTLDIAKIEAGKMDVQLEAFDIDELVETFAEQLTTLAEAKGLDFKVQCDPQLSCFSDPRKVRQIIVNLASNAIKYTPQGVVSVQVVHAHSGYLGEVMRITVTDTGVGIPAEQIDKLFNAYHQLKDETNKNIQGTGLGLALVAELVKLLDGDISVQSEKGSGSSFTVLIPLIAS